MPKTRRHHVNLIFLIAPRNTSIAAWNSGLNSGGWNASFDQNRLALHADGESPDLLRFHRSRPTASIGRHQALEREIRLDYCRQRGIEAVRRASGGGALYLDENQQGISLIFRRPAEWAGLELAQILARVCAALAGGLAHLGISTRFKAPNDLEIDGRKLASAFVAIQGDSLLLHATLLCDADIKTMLKTLRVPTEKLTITGLESARQRLVTLKELLGKLPEDVMLQQALRLGIADALGVDFVDAAAEIVDANGCGNYGTTNETDWSEADDGELKALHKMPGGVLRVRLWLDAEEEQIAKIQFSGDLNLHPSDTLERLERTLAGLPLAEAEAAARAFFAGFSCDLLGFDPEDLCRVLRLTLNKLDQQREFGLSPVQANGLMVLDSGAARDAPAILAQATVMLLPYCAKPAWCEWRHQDDCVECGKCAVGDAYRLARERNMQVTTITDYEHLTATLGQMQSDGVAAYVGACCSQFFIKRHLAFREAGMAAVLMDISGANCYELKQEESAYAGQFQAEAQLDADMLAKVMQHVPAQPDEQPQGEAAAPVTGNGSHRAIPLIPINEARKNA
jgi:lipoate-protein ligase A